LRARGEGPKFLLIPYITPQNFCKKEFQTKALCKANAKQNLKGYESRKGKLRKKEKNKKHGKEISRKKKLEKKK
jgi:hypothetical protein